MIGQEEEKFIKTDDGGDDSDLQACQNWSQENLVNQQFFETSFENSESHNHHEKKDQKSSQHLLEVSSLE